MDDTLSQEFELYPIATWIQQGVFERKRRGINFIRSFEEIFVFQVWILVVVIVGKGLCRCTSEAKVWRCEF